MAPESHVPGPLVRPATLAAFLILVGAVVLAFRPIYEPDLWWHLAQGRENAQGRFVRTNVFSFGYGDYRQLSTDDCRLQIDDCIEDCGLGIGLRIGDWIADWELDCGLRTGLGIDAFD